MDSLKPSLIRYLEGQVVSDLERKMVFVGGPRQVGKTTLAKKILQNEAGYLNWDYDADREIILRRELPNTQFLVFDEIHKYRGWRNFLKGLYDKHGDKKKILVTGSARLDFYRFGGDSLQGRYHYLRLHPFSVAEIDAKSQADLLELYNLGGFPEPFFGASKVNAKRWSREYRSRLLEEDLSALENIVDISKLELLMLRLPDLVGSPLSVNALREDLQVAHMTVKRWLEILERLYSIFRLSPFGAPNIRAVKKEQKHYHLDWTLIPNDGERFENFMACHLLKWVHFEQDVAGRDLELRYFRDVDKREVDFVITENRKPIQLVECKLGSGEVSKGLKYMAARFPNTPAVQVVLNGQKDIVSKEGIRVMPALKFLQDLI